MFLCGGCLRHDPWMSLKIKSGSPLFNSNKLIYPATNFSHDLEIEFLYSNYQLSAYINVYLEQIPAFEKDEKTALLKIDTPAGSTKFLVHRLSGGQRLKIPEDLMDQFLSLFEQNASLTLKLQGPYNTKVSCKTFKQHLKTLKLQQIDLIPSNPIRVYL